MADDPLEDELASTFRPAPMSLELRERIGAELTYRSARHVMRVATLVAAAACIVIGIMIPMLSVDRIVTPPLVPNETVVSVAASSPPTVLDYQRAFAKSSESLEALLARPAGGGVAVSDSPAEPARAFSRSFNGESL